MSHQIQPESLGMSHQTLLESNHHQAARDEVSAPMRALTAEELREVAGGPVIQNGGGGT